MDQRSTTLFFFFSSSFFFMAGLHFNSKGVEAYKNYTVGDSLGWFDNLRVPDVNYQKWADSKNFTLGDFLSK